MNFGGVMVGDENMTFLSSFHPTHWRSGFTGSGEFLPRSLAFGVYWLCRVSTPLTGVRGFLDVFKTEALIPDSNII